MAWVDADPETVRRECTPKEVQEAFERKWKRDAHNEQRVAKLEAALREIYRRCKGDRDMIAEIAKKALEEK